MTEPNDNLESRLSSLRPRPVTPSLECRIARMTASPAPSRVALGLFWTAVSGGAVAASIILALLTTQNVRPVSGGSVALLGPPKPPSFTVLASVDWHWGDDLKIDFNESRRLP